MVSLSVPSRRAMRLLLTLTLLGLLATPSAHAQDLPPPKFTVELEFLLVPEPGAADEFEFQARLTCTEWSPYLIEKSIQLHYDLIVARHEKRERWVEVEPFRTNDKPSPEDCLEQRPIVHRLVASAPEIYGAISGAQGFTEHNISLLAQEKRFGEHWWANGTIQNPMRGNIQVETGWHAKVGEPGFFAGNFLFENNLNVPVVAEYKPVVTDTTPGVNAEPGAFAVDAKSFQRVRVGFNITSEAIDGADTITLALEVNAHPEGYPELAFETKYVALKFEVDPPGSTSHTLLRPPPLVVVLLVTVVFVVVRHQQRSKLP